jgi:hypothetical protein
LISESHDTLKLRRSGKDAWIAFTRPRLDDRTFEKEEDPDEVLGVAWEALTAEQPLPDSYLHFKNAASWAEYNRTFGSGALREAVIVGLERAARRTGMFAVIGTRPDQAMKAILKAFEEANKKAFDPHVRVKLHGILASLAPAWPGRLIEPEIEREISFVARNSLVNLGLALFPDPDDMPAFGRAAPFDGTTVFGAIDAKLAEFVSGNGVSAAERRLDFTAAVAIFGDALNAALADRFRALDNPPGRSAELLRQFMKLNVMHWWSEAVRRAATKALRALLGQALRNRFSEIDPAFAKALSQYGVNAEGWELIRESHGIVKSGVGSKEALQAARDGLDAWLEDRLIVVALDSDAEGHAGFSRGAADFTAEGELLRFLAQFRIFRAPFLPHPHGTLDVREADEAVHQAMAGGDGLPALTSLLTWTVLFARLSELGFDRLKGKASAQSDQKALIDAAVVGGAFGFCADILFGEATGIKSATLSSMTEIDHPAIASALGIWRRACAGEDVRAELAVWAKDQGDSGALDRLQVTRQTLNYALLHQLQNMVSPGYLQRTVKDMQARVAQSHWSIAANPPDDRTR